LLSACVFTIRAQSVNHSVEPAANATISYGGTVDNMMRFTVKFDNAEKYKHRLRICDKYSSTYYSECFSGAVYYKTFSVPAYEGNVIFIFENLKTKSKSTFVTSSTQRNYTDVAIRKLE
jgi:hypothetical protein